jgi:hypothetical protein
MEHKFDKSHHFENSALTFASLVLGSLIFGVERKQCQEVTMGPKRGQASRFIITGVLKEKNLPC